MSQAQGARVARSEWTPGLFAAGGIVAITAIGFLLFNARGSAPDALYIDESMLDLGTVWARSDLRWTLQVQNRDSKRIIVSQLEASCACTEVAPASFSLAPNSQQKLNLSLDLFPPSGKVREHESLFGVSLDFRDQFGRRLGQKTLHGNVRYPLSGTTEILYFGPDELIENVAGPVKDCEFKRDFDVASVIVGKHDFPGTAVFEESGDGRTVWLYVTPSETLEAGRFEHVIPLIATLKDGTRLPSFPIRVAGWVRSDITTVPSRLYLPPSPIGETVRTTLQVQAVSGDPFRVTSVETDSKELTVELLDSAAPDGPLYEVRRRIASSGAANHTLRFAIERRRGKGSTVIVPVSSYGLVAGQLSP